MSEAKEVRVWDRFVRLFHWGVAGGFGISYLTGGEIEKLHSTMGYIIVSLLLARLAWGVFGSRHARFSDFIYRPRVVVDYLRDLIRLRAKRYLGHSPAGGAMVVALMISMLATASVGMTLYAIESGKGPLTLVLEKAPEVVGPKKDENSFLVNLHGFLAGLTLWLVIFHLGGVALASFAHGENLPRAMITGRKRS